MNISAVNHDHDITVSSAYLRCQSRRYSVFCWTTLVVIRAYPNSNLNGSTAHDELGRNLHNEVALWLLDKLDSRCFIGHDN
jgi:hypothetical protein